MFKIMQYITLSDLTKKVGLIHELGCKIC